MNLLLSGLRAWTWQRISAVYLWAYVLYVLVYLLGHAPLSYEDWRGWLMSPVMNAATVLFFFMLLVHLWVGVRNVLMDYVHPRGLRTTLLALLGVAVLAHGVWVLRILW
jgi:succinate dehydrogenase / fumarate reductase membrane anchor subunit